MPPQTQVAEELNSKSRIWIPISIVLLLIALIGYFSLRTRAVGIRYATVTRGTITSTISTNGKIEPIQNFEAHAPASTTVSKVFVAQGDHVKPGQLLLELDDSGALSDTAKAQAEVAGAEAELNAIKNGGTHEEVLTTQADLARARTELAAAQSNLQTLQRLSQSGAASPAEVQNAENRVKTAQAQVDLQQQRSGNRFSPLEQEKAQANLAQAKAAYSATQAVLAKSVIHSPILGEVYSLPVKQGSFLSAGDLLVQVADLSHVMLRAYVDQPDLGRLAKGQTVLVTWDALPGRTWQGVVTQVPTTVVMHGSRSVGEVTCDIDNSDRKLLPNIDVSVTIVTTKHDNVVMAPREAIHQSDGKRYVLEVQGDRLVRRDVETSISNLTDVEITSGVSPGAKLGLGAYNNQALHEGMKVSTQ
ncbi:MAG TPA: efflux RND transporter periplasmic adaptor subunit [Terriglobales bacterium]|nr:efflux RND transporter periplasmic adaptor subunit [Terriglobales bacterium]